MGVVVYGLDPVEGETAFAFCVFKLRQAVSRAALLELLRYMGPLIPDSDTVIEELLPEDLEQAVQIIAVPWLPPEAGHGIAMQRRLVETAATLGVEEAWFFQTGTSLPGEQDDDEDEIDDATQAGQRAFTRDEAWIAENDDDTKTSPIELIDASGADFDSDLDDEDDDLDDVDEDEDDDDDDDGDDDEMPVDDAPVSWSHGPPPQAVQPRFPVDGYPAIIEELDWEDVGLAVKLAGDILPGEGTVLLGFHTLWLAPYGGRYRHAAVTIDRAHHAAHFWVDRFAVQTPAEEQVRHLLWIVSKLDEVVPIVHARFVGATMVQKYGGLMGDTSEPFVLGGNPLLAVYAAGGQDAVDQWLEEQTVWSAEEVAQMLRELAIEIVTGDDEHPVEEDDEGDGDDDDDEEEDEDEDEDDDDDDDDDDDAAEGDDDEDRGRQITTYAGDVLRARAAQGKLDSRVADRLLPVLAVPEKFEHRRHAVVDILRALRHRAAVPRLIELLEGTTIKGAVDSVGKEDLIATTAAALGAIRDPAAIPLLSKVVAAPGTHNDAPRAAAADALAACLAATPEPRTIDDGVLAELLTTIRERNDGELNAETHFAYGRLVRLLPPDKRAAARNALADADTARDDAIAMLARQAALVLASPTSRVDAPPRDLAPLLHEGLTSLDYDHEYTVRNLRVALQVADLVPEVLDPEDLGWLTTFVEPEIRERAHALLAKLGKPLDPAPVFDRYAVRELGDHELIRLIAESRVIGRASLITEAGRRGLSRAKRGIIDACHDVVSRARRGGENLLDPDTRILEAAVPILRRPPLDEQVVALFDRMLRHTNYHVKWELLQKTPHDERLIAGMFHVLGEKWGWQETAAKEWLAAFHGTPAYEVERKRATSSAATPDDDDLDDGGNAVVSDDEDIN